MSRVIFNNQPAPPVIDTGRADVACFVGLVRLVAGAAMPATLAKWLTTLGYTNQPGGPRFTTQAAALTQVPLMIESYRAFTALFDDGSSGGGYGTDYVAAAIRSFFAQGGKRCYVVRTGDPLDPADAGPGQAAKLQGLLLNPLYDTGDASTWTGIGALAALEEVSYVATPDLPALCASEPVGAAGQPPVIPAGPQQFTPCTQGQMVPRQQVTFPAAAPRLALADYRTWAKSVASILNYLSGGALTHQLHLHEMQYVAAFPMPQELDVATASEHPSAVAIAQDLQGILHQYLPETVEPSIVSPYPPFNLSSCFLQLAYPWLKTSGSGTLLEELEPPDGVLAGLLARNALTRGAFTSATKVMPSEVYDVQPPLPSPELQSATTALRWGPGAAQKALIERVSLFGPTPAGFQLLSDVTAYPGESYRAGAVNRLVNVICRAARMIGETSVFENNGPALWGKITRALNTLMLDAWAHGALDGASPAQAFSVRCDRSTMTQNDLDNGRLVALVTFTAAAIVETITVTLAMETTGTSAQAIASAAATNNLANSTMAGVS
jgi:hypothetical protein